MKGEASLRQAAAHNWKTPHYDSKVILQVSGGTCQVLNARKKQQLLVGKLVEQFIEKTPVRTMEIEISGFHRYRELLLNRLFKALKVVKVTDKTKLPHNGCRRPKKRRL